MDRIKVEQTSSFIVVTSQDPYTSQNQDLKVHQKQPSCLDFTPKRTTFRPKAKVEHQDEDMPNSNESSETEKSGEEQKEFIELSKIERDSSDQDRFVEHEGSFDGIVAGAGDDFVAKYNASINTDVNPSEKNKGELSKQSIEKQDPEAEHPQEVNKAALFIQDLQQVLSASHKFQQKFVACQQQINDCDLSSVEQDLLARSIQLQYQTIKPFAQKKLKLVKSLDGFGGLEWDISEISKKVQETNSVFTKMKGDFLAVNEPIINKDSTNFKLQKVQEQAELQSQLVGQFLEMELEITQNRNELMLVKNQIGNFEKLVFEYFQSETLKCIEASDKKLKFIDESLRSSEVQIGKLSEMASLASSNLESEKTLFQKAVVIQEKIKGSKEKFKKKCHDFEFILNANQKIEPYTVVNGMSPQLIQKSVSQTQKIHELLDNYEAFMKFLASLKQIEVFSIDPISQHLNDLEKELNDFEAQAQHEKKKCETDLTSQLRESTQFLSLEVKRILERLTFQEDTIDALKQENLLSKRNLEALSYMSLEIQRQKQSLSTLESNFTTLSSNYENKEVQQLKSSLKALERLEAVDLKRAQNNFAQVDCQFMKLLKNQSIDDNKVTHELVTSLKAKSEEMSLKLESVNTLLRNQFAYVQKLREFFSEFPNDLERSMEFQATLSTKLGEYELKINDDQDQSSLKCQRKKVLISLNKVVMRFNENKGKVPEDLDQDLRVKQFIDKISKTKQIQKSCFEVRDAMKDVVEGCVISQQALEKVVQGDLKEKYQNKNQEVLGCFEVLEVVSQKAVAIFQNVDTFVEQVKGCCLQLQNVKDMALDHEIQLKEDLDEQNQLTIIKKQMIERAQNIIDAILAIQDGALSKDQIQELVKPLQNLGNQEVTLEKVHEVKKQLDGITESQNLTQQSLGLKKNEIDQLQRDLKSLKENEKTMRIDIADANLSFLSDKIQQLQASQGKSVKKFAKLHGLIGKILALEKQEADPSLESQIKQMNSENPMIERDLKEIQDKISVLEGKRDDTLAKMNDQMQSKDLTAVFYDIDEEYRVTEILEQMLQNIQKLLNNKILTFTEVLKRLNLEKDITLKESQKLQKKTDQQFLGLDGDLREAITEISGVKISIQTLMKTTDASDALLGDLKDYESSTLKCDQHAKLIAQQIEELREMNTKNQIQIADAQKNFDLLKFIQLSQLFSNLEKFQNLLNQAFQDLEKLSTTLTETSTNIQKICSTVNLSKQQKLQKLQSLSQQLNLKQGEIQELNQRNFQELSDLDQSIQIARKDSCQKQNQGIFEFQEQLKQCQGRIGEIQPSVQMVKKVAEENLQDLGELNERFESASITEIDEKLEVILGQIQQAELLFDEEEKISDQIDSLTEMFIEITKSIQEMKSEKTRVASEDLAIIAEQIDSCIDPVKESCQKMLKQILSDLTEADQYEHNDEKVSHKIVIGLNEHNFFSIGVDQLDTVYPQVQEALHQYNEQLMDDKILQFSFEDLELQSQQIMSLKEKVDLLQEKYEVSHGKIQGLLERVQKILGKFKAWMRLQEQKEKVNREIHQGLQKTKKIYDYLPGKMQEIMAVGEEMKAGTGPNQSADYFDKKAQIEEWLIRSQQADEAVAEKKAEFLELAQIATTMYPKAHIDQIEDRILTLHQDIQDSLKSAKDLEAQYLKLEKDMGDCSIDKTVQKRKQEFDSYSQKLDRIQDELKDLKQANLTFSGSKPKAEHIKKVIKEIDQKIAEQESQRFTHSETQLFWLEQLQQDSSMSNRDKIVQIRNQKEQIEESVLQLRIIDSLMKQLNTLLFHKDIDNIQKQLKSQIGKLRERMTVADLQLKKIFTAGKELDGETSTIEEEEFISELFSGEQQIIHNFKTNFDQIDFVTSLIQRVGSSKKDEMMVQAKDKIEEQQSKVSQCEVFVENLQKEGVEQWDAQGKISRRQKELNELGQRILQLFQIGLNQDLEELKKQLNLKQIQGQMDESAQDHIDALVGSISECEQLIFESQNLQMEHEKCSSEFNKKVSQQEVEKRNNFSKTEEELMYRQITVSCMFKRKIKAMQGQSNQVRSQIKTFREKIKRDLSIARKVESSYEPLVDDPIDQLFAKHLNQSQINLPVQRISAGKYLFGTKQVHAKIQNNNLLIRVGGGYMGAQEFINQYGPVELAKFMKQKGLNPEGLIPQNGSKKSFRSIDINEFQNKMKLSIQEKLSQHQKKQAISSPARSSANQKYQSDVIYQQEPLTARKTVGSPIVNKKWVSN